MSGVICQVLGLRSQVSGLTCLIFFLQTGSVLLVDGLLSMGPTMSSSYSTRLAEHDVHRLRRCPAFGQAMTGFFLSVQLDAHESLQGGHMTMAD